MPDDTIHQSIGSPAKEPFYIRDMLDGVARKMTPDLQRHAKRAGWPQEVAESLKFGHTGGMLSVESDMMDRVESLEYGGPDVPPRPAITNYLTAHTTKRRTIKEVAANGGTMARVVNKWFS